MKKALVNGRKHPHPFSNYSTLHKNPRIVCLTVAEIAPYFQTFQSSTQCLENSQMQLKSKYKVQKKRKLDPQLFQLNKGFKKSKIL